MVYGEFLLLAVYFVFAMEVGFLCGHTLRARAPLVCGDVLRKPWQSFVQRRVVDWCDLVSVACLKSLVCRAATVVPFVLYLFLVVCTTLTKPLRTFVCTCCVCCVCCVCVC